MPTVMTVTGPVEASDLGFTLVHEHIFLDMMRDEWSVDRFLNDPELAYRELMLYKEAGGVTVVDQTNGGLRGNDQFLLPVKHAEGVRQVAERTGLNIVLGSGWYREKYYEPYLWRAKTDQIAEEIVTELTEGIEGTGIRAGIIGEIGSQLNWVSPVEERVFRAAARAHKATGVTVSTHTAWGPVGLDQLDILDQEGVPLDRVIVSHANSDPRIEYHREIARRGAYISIEGMGSRNDHDQSTELRSIRNILDAGLIDHLLLSHDVCVRWMYTTYGGGGYAYIPNQFVHELRDIGVSAAEFRQIMVDNPRRALTGES